MCSMENDTLDNLIKFATEKGIYLSVIGMGVDFNTETTNLITKH